MIKRLRKTVKSKSQGQSLPYLFRWLLNLTLFFFLTISLFKEALRVYRNGFIPDVIYAHNQYAALAGYLLRIVWRKSNVTRLYGTFLADLMEKPFVTLRYPTASAGYIVPSSLLICANDGTRGDQVALKLKVPESRFRFWQNGVEPPSGSATFSRSDLADRFGPELRIDSKWIITCSRLSYWKRIDRMIKALTVCKTKKVNCQLLVAGDGPELPRLVKLVEKLKVTDYVVWLGAVAHDDIWSLMNVSDIFMITNDVTNRCNPLYEAACAGLPVVSVFDPSTNDLLSDGMNALLVDKDDTNALGEKLVELCNDSGLAEMLKNQQKKLSETFWTWEARMRVEVAELEKLLETQ